MNERMRRYLDDDYNEHDEHAMPESESMPRKTAKQPPQDRRQQEKERGKAIAKDYRERKKETNRIEKP
ncbi:MAG: hypothetical protein H0X37_04710 [Herpetosiphonaceae bacterium]|nr:hypothetical protein [Herpetosiphonaceae bacterium]